MSQNLSGLVAPDEKRKSDFQETNEYPGLKEIHAENGYSIEPLFFSRTRNVLSNSTWLFTSA
jgi:hypothetical protein